MSEMMTYPNTTLATQQATAPLPYPATAQELAPAPTQSMVSLAEWANEALAIQGLAEGLSQTSFVPTTFKGKPGEITAMMLKGKSLDLDPMQALEMFYVVHGRVGMYAKAMLQLVLRAGHSLYAVERNEQQVTVRAQRKGESHYTDYTWSVARATLAGYTSNAKYKSNPTEMLQWKAIAEACKFTFPDVLGGLVAVEDLELDDYAAEATATSQAGQAPARKQVQRKPRTKKTPTPEPVTVAATPAEETPATEELLVQETTDPQTGEITQTEAPAPQLISKLTQGKISQAFDALGVTDPAEKRRMVQEHLRLEALAGVNHLTVEQGEAVLGWLEREKAVDGVA